MTVEPKFDDDNPEWTKADFARARPANEVLPPEIIAAFGKGKRASGGAIDETAHLLSTEANATRLNHGIAELDAGLGLERDLMQP